ncbi:metallophosphoesterase domain-containing protein [Talaromyces proteolyticus]|uniref:Metallophosphoesterase domain-containing protein n=1 Tax=Talaromyces proteolyticus TaxID=1131652 RepID=A0AAD4KE41_9EURO|nr:metallophosphoesterase domain-containing protein [Talaromyces proteolyticus]KAH8689478.1 metallophosphoesterase domain-containing protein [Talaromyces proteolyticus]
MPVETISRPMVGPPAKKRLVQQLAVKLYSKVRQIQDLTTKQGPNSPRPTIESPVTLVCLSDTHNSKPASLPPGDILVHAGDLSQFGTFPEIQAQLTWLSAQPHRHKVVVAGNHDLLLDRNFVAAHPDRELDKHADLEWGDGNYSLHYLEHETIEFAVESPNDGEPRRVSVFGSPWTPRCGNWAFQYQSGKDAQFDWIGVIPNDTDIAVLHGPPKGHLDDGGKGCGMLLEELWRARPAVVVCGHIHPGRGEEWLWYDNIQRWYDNVILERKQWVSVLCLAVVYVWVLIQWAVGKPGKGRSPERQYTRLINAAVVGSHGGGAMIATI